MRKDNNFKKFHERAHQTISSLDKPYRKCLQIFVEN